jgi:hypothetical protein
MNIQLLHLFLSALKSQLIIYDENPSFHLRHFSSNKRNCSRNLSNLTYIPRIKRYLIQKLIPNSQNKESLGLIDNILDINALF